MRHLVIGIDYGTSNSGVSYALFDDNDNPTPDDVELSVITDLATGKHGQDSSEKIPSDIAYDRRTWEPYAYSYELRPRDGNALQWVKLLLEPSGFQDKEEEKIQKLWTTYRLLGSHKRPVDVVRDYLKWLWSRAKSSITKKLDGLDLFFEKRSETHLTVVFTVPASWSERGKQGILKAATEAGITQEADGIRLISEAEAAAIYGLRVQARDGAIDDEDCIIVCDAGGGTVDVVSYQVLSRDPLSLDQRTTPEGEFCGSVFIDLEFQNQLRSILGTFYDDLDYEAKSHIDDTFEFKIKRTYHPERAPEQYNLQLTETQETKIDSAVVKQSFQEVISPIGTLIENQVERLEELGLDMKLKGILLVGGLSKSNYIYDQIHSSYADMRVWRTEEAWTAVSQGAVYCTSTSVIHSRLSRRNYGILYREGDERKVHWIVKKGTSVQSNMATEPYGLRIDDQDFLHTDESFWVSVTLIRSDEDDAREDFNRDSAKPHAVIDCKFPTTILNNGIARLIQDEPKAWHIPARFVPVLNGAVITFRCQVGEEDVGITEVGYFDQAPSDQDFHPDPDQISTSQVQRSGSVQENDAKFGHISTVNSAGGQSSMNRIKDYHFNTRTSPDTPPEHRPRPGTLPGLFARGWIPRADFYDDYVPPENNT